MRTLWRGATFGGAVVLALGLSPRVMVAQSGVEPEPIAADTPQDIGSVIRVGVGLGVGSVNNLPIAYRLALAVALDRDEVITVRHASIRDFPLLGDDSSLFSTPDESVWDVGVLYGWQALGTDGYLAVSAGIGLAGGMRRGRLLESTVILILPANEYEEDPFHTVGIPLELDAGWTFSDWLGLGVSVFGSLNPVRSAAGGTVNVLVGSVR